VQYQVTDKKVCRKLVLNMLSVIRAWGWLKTQELFGGEWGLGAKHHSLSSR
jgi:hypothetical protein